MSSAKGIGLVMVARPLPLPLLLPLPSVVVGTGVVVIVPVAREGSTRVPFWHCSTSLYKSAKGNSTYFSTHGNLPL